MNWIFFSSRSIILLEWDVILTLEDRVDGGLLAQSDESYSLKPCEHSMELYNGHSDCPNSSKFQLRINQMTAILITIGSIAAIVGIGVATWSIISTRKKYYDEYMKRKRAAED